MVSIKTRQKQEISQYRLCKYCTFMRLLIILLSFVLFFKLYFIDAVRAFKALRSDQVWVATLFAIQAR